MEKSWRGSFAEGTEETREVGVLHSKHNGGAFAVAYSPDGSRLVSGGDDNSVRLWSAETYDETIELYGRT